uniref:Uncharacterized protein n=1 Tax=Anopheles albimanus TaxID=7167 RepID=A0A182FY50_ANOAL
MMETPSMAAAREE